MERPENSMSSCRRKHTERHAVRFEKQSKEVIKSANKSDLSKNRSESIFKSVKRTDEKATWFHPSHEHDLMGKIQDPTLAGPAQVTAEARTDLRLSPRADTENGRNWRTYRRPEDAPGSRATPKPPARQQAGRLAPGRANRIRNPNAPSRRNGSRPGPPRARRKSQASGRA